MERVGQRCDRPRERAPSLSRLNSLAMTLIARCAPDRYRDRGGCTQLEASEDRRQFVLRLFGSQGSGGIDAAGLNRRTECRGRGGRDQHGCGDRQHDRIVRLDPVKLIGNQAARRER